MIAAGLGPSWDLLVDYPLTDFRDYQTLPFPLSYDGPLNTGSTRRLPDATAPSRCCSTTCRSRSWSGSPARLVALARRPLAPRVIATGVLRARRARLPARPHRPLPHRAAGGDGRDPRRLGARGAAAAAARRAGRARRRSRCVFAIAEGLDRRWLVLREDTVALDLPVADGVRVPPRQAAELEAVVRPAARRAARSTSPPAAPTSSPPATRCCTCWRAARTRPATTSRRPASSPRAPVQREIVRDLERTRTPMVVRWTDPVTAAAEPNAAGRSSGVPAARRLPGAALRAGGARRLVPPARAPRAVKQPGREHRALLARPRRALVRRGVGHDRGERGAGSAGR